MRPRPIRRGFTLVEILIVFGILAAALLAIFELNQILWKRITHARRRAEGEMAVRILMARLRQELRHASRPVTISNLDRQILAIPLVDATVEEGEDPSRPREYISEYEFRPEQKEIWYRKYSLAEYSPEGGGTPLEERLWLGGNTPVAEVSIEHTDEEKRILFQFYRVMVKISYYDLKFKKTQGQADSSEDTSRLLHAATTVYPRRINQELRIEVPQD